MSRWHNFQEIADLPERAFRCVGKKMTLEGGGGGGGGGPAPIKYAPAFGGVVPTAPTAPVAPTASPQMTWLNDLVGMYQPRQTQYNPYQPQYNPYQPQNYGNPNAQAIMGVLGPATQQYNQFGPQNMQYGLAQGQYGRNYRNYVSDVGAYNNQVQDYRNTYGSGYSGYNAPATITASPYGAPPPRTVDAVGKGSRGELY